LRLGGYFESPVTEYFDFLMYATAEGGWGILAESASSDSINWWPRKDAATVAGQGL